MRVSVELPDPKVNGLDAAVAKQYAEIQQHLMRLVESKDHSSKAMHQLMIASMEAQQQTLVKAMERLMAMISQRPKETGQTHQLLDMMQGLRTTLAALPHDLKEALDHQYHAIQTKMMPRDRTSQVTVKMPQGFMARIDSLESALLQGLHRSRSRTFGSNY